MGWMSPDWTLTPRDRAWQSDLEETSRRQASLPRFALGFEIHDGGDPQLLQGEKSSPRRQAEEAYATRHSGGSYISCDLELGSGRTRASFGGEGSTSRALADETVSMNVLEICSTGNVGILGQNRGGRTPGEQTRCKHGKSWRRASVETPLEGSLDDLS